MKQFLTFLIALLISGTYSEIKAQKMAPDFTLEKLSGGDFTLSDHRGKVVLLFNFGYNCGNCKAAAPTVKSVLLNEFSSNENFIAVGIDDWDGSSSGVRNFKNSTGLNIPLLLKGSSVVNSFDSNYDHLIVIDGQGYVVFQESQQGSGRQAPRAKSVILSSLEALSTPVESLDSNLTSLEQNYPNPFSDATNFRFNLKASSYVSLDIYNLSGKHVTRITNGIFPAGKNEITFDAKLPSGMYLYKLDIAGDQHIKKMLVK